MASTLADDFREAMQSPKFLELTQAAGDPPQAVLVLLLAAAVHAVRPAVLPREAFVRLAGIAWWAAMCADGQMGAEARVEQIIREAMGAAR